MKFKIVRSNFFKTLSHLQGIVDKKNSLPILSNILIEAKDNDFRKVMPDIHPRKIHQIGGRKITEVSNTQLTLPTIYSVKK